MGDAVWATAISGGVSVFCIARGWQTAGSIGLFMTFLQSMAILGMAKP